MCAREIETAMERERKRPKVDFIQKHGRGLNHDIVLVILFCYFILFFVRFFRDVFIALTFSNSHNP